MKDEIKEILEYVLSLTYGNENATKGIDKVKDYITNLQGECAKLREERDYFRNKINNITSNLKLSIYGIDNILITEKVLKIVNGRIVNRNKYQIVRLKAIKTKCNELLNIIQGGAK